MSKQDKCGVRTASDLERKYDFSNLTGKSISNTRLEEQVRLLNQTLTQFVANTNTRFEELEDIERVVTHFYSGVPTLSNEPAISWETEEQKEEHIGDLYYDTDNKHLYLFKSTDGVYEWVECTGGGTSNGEEDLTGHTTLTNNPHNVTASQVGLGNVPNVATNDQTPTYTENTSVTALTSGEKLTVAFGKIAKAITDFISHLANKSNPHGVTASQVGLGNVNNTSDANKPISTAVQNALNGKANSSHTHSYAATNHTHSYLPLSGGTLTGTLTGASAIGYSVAYTTEVGMFCKWRDGANHNLITRSTDGLTSLFGWNGTSSYATVGVLRGSEVRLACGNHAGTSWDQQANVLGLKVVSSVPYVRPGKTGTMCLGSSSYRWKGIYSAASVSVSSDRRTKNNINYDVREELMDLVYNSKPVSFNYNHDELNIKHYGMIAQDVRDYLINNNLELFAGLGINMVNEERECSNLYENEDVVFYSMKYEQYVPALISVAQEQKIKLDSIKEEMQQLKELVTKLVS